MLQLPKKHTHIYILTHRIEILFSCDFGVKDEKEEDESIVVVFRGIIGILLDTVDRNDTM